MFLSLKKMLVGSAAVALMACAGPAGPQGEAGPAGPAGPQGPGLSAGPSISAVVPNNVLAGKSLSVEISGFATTWKSASAPTVDFGSGITVSKVTVASATALVVDITVADGTAPGAHTVTVTNGTEVSKFESAFEIVPPLAQVGANVQAPQLGLSVIKLQNNDPDFTFSSTSGDWAFTGADGLNAALWGVQGNTALIAVLPELTTALGAQELHISTTGTGGQNASITVTVTVKPAAPENAPGNIVTGTFAAANTSKTYKWTAAAGGDVTVGASWDDATATGKPSFIVFDNTGTVMGAVADSNNGKFTANMGADYYFVVYTGDTTGAFTVTVAATLPDMEPNNNIMQATAGSLPFAADGDITFSTDVNDFYKVTVDAAQAGKTIVFNHTGGGADYVIELLAADGTTSVAKSGNMYDDKVLTTPAVAAGDYYVRVGTYGTAYDGTYRFTATLK